jgi:uncharacterized protein
MMIRTLFPLLLASLPLVSHAGDIERYHTVQVTGTYNVKAAPDIAYVDFTVLSDAKELEAAKAKADDVLRTVKAVSLRMGVAEKDLKTGYVSIQPRYTYLENRPPLLEGYNVSYTITMTVRKLDDLGKNVQRLVEAGVTQVNNVRYDLDQSEAFKQDALRQAVGNAKAKAAILAEAAGETLGGALQIQEGFVNYNPPVMAFAAAPRMMKAEMSADASGGEIPPAGELDVSAQVSIIYELKE